MSWLIALLGGAGLWTWLRSQRRIFDLTAQLRVAQQSELRVPLLEAALKMKEEELLQLRTRVAMSASQEGLVDTFRAMSADALEKNRSSFIELAKGELAPLQESLHRLDRGLHLIEKERKGEQAGLQEQLRALQESERVLRQEAASLARALRSPVSRGRWGELQLRRVVEMAGMISHCDFTEQCTQITDEAHLRPDLIVRLAGERQVIVDAKVPLDAYLEAMDAQEEAPRLAKLKEHAKLLRNHIAKLGKRGYWEHFEASAEFVVLFLPCEPFFSMALEADPTLIEYGIEHDVMLATPTTLIALLRAIAFGWKQQQLTQHAKQIKELGQELYKRLVDMADHWLKMGRSLSSSVEAYNRAVGSLEARVLVTARKFQELGASPGNLEIAPLEPVDRALRSASLDAVDPP